MGLLLEAGMVSEMFVVFHSQQSKAGETLLIDAARSNNVAAVKTLALDAEIVDETDNEEWSALLNGARKGHIEVVKSLLENGTALDQPDYLGWTPLMWAVYKCRPDVVDLLLNYGAHVNLIDEEDGLTPQIVASGRGFTTVVEKLLAADAQVNACDKYGSTALIWAARKGHLPIVQMLLNAGAEVLGLKANHPYVDVNGQTDRRADGLQRIQYNKE